MTKKLSWLDKYLNISSTEIENLLINIVDVGSAGTPPLNCQNLAPISTYLGFDADLREPQSGNHFGFAKYITIDKAVTASKESSVQFYLTEYPQCSSTLIPDKDQVKHYSISGFFNIVGQSIAPAIRLDEAIFTAKLSHIDWLKLDTQGTDYDILKSLSIQFIDKLLVVDLEPGITAFYKGENRFSEIHEFMLNNGFWLANFDQQRFPRISKSTIEKLNLTDIEVSLLGGSPFAAELQYFRTIESLKENSGDKRDFFAFWLLAMANSNYAFAIEIALAGKFHGFNQEMSQELVSITLETCKYEQCLKNGNILNRFYTAMTPPIVSRFVRRLRKIKL